MSSIAATTTSALRIALVDDHALFRDAFRALAGRHPEVALVADISSVDEAFPLLDRTPVDVVLVDVALPGSSGLALVREIHRRKLGARIAVLTMHALPEFAIEALEAGATGYILKSQPGTDVFQAIEAIARGETYLAPALDRAAIFDEIERRRNRPDEPGGPLSALSRREREVFELAVRNFSNREIGKELCISVKTVETHRMKINRKLGVHSAAELVRFAARHGLLIS